MGKRPKVFHCVQGTSRPSDYLWLCVEFSEVFILNLLSMLVWGTQILGMLFGNAIASLCVVLLRISFINLYFPKLVQLLAQLSSQFLRVKTGLLVEWYKLCIHLV